VNRAHPDNLMYCMYTSGSTGQPKGVAVTHAAAAAFLRWSCATFGGEQVRVLFSTSICFDPSVFELFTALLTGGSAAVVENALALLDAPARDSVTLVNAVPSAVDALLSGGCELPSVRVISMAGEALPRALPARIHAAFPQASIWNLYGSTETTYSTYGRIDPASGAPVTIGQPIPDAQVYVLEAAFEPGPAGVTGQIHIGGAAIARGYLHRPATTAERFIPNPYGAPGSRMYASGDLARYRCDGTIELIGRADHQVKIRGYRIELGEIETRLRELPSVREAIALVYGPPDKERLVAYYTLADGANAVTVEALRAHLRASLPEYMIPAAYVALDAFPLAPNGKLDRNALPAPEKPRREPPVVRAAAPVVLGADGGCERSVSPTHRIAPERRDEPGSAKPRAGAHRIAP
jgi:acyl-coenzyme A synthetase/AMP-(fatty) acid ligase